MDKVLLHIEHLTKRYDKDTVALRDVSIDFKEGDFVVVIGPSGAGKSTLIRCINRMLDATDGKILFDGQEISGARGQKLRVLRSEIGMVFQNYNLIGRVNVVKNVLYGRLGHMPLWKSLLGKYSREERKAAFALLEKVGLKDQAYKRADALSGGQMQRVGICRALIQEPKLLLADEPIASLDPKSAEIVMEQMHDITSERGLTCIVNLHQVDFARRYASRIVGIRDGQVVFDGAPDELTEEMTAFIYQGKEHEMKLKESGPSRQVSVKKVVVQNG